MPVSIPISDVVNVTLNLPITAQPNRGFGRKLVVGNSTTSTLVLLTPKLYSASAWDTGMIADGYLSTDKEYLAVQTWFAQSPKPVDVLVAKSTTTPTAANLTTINTNDDSWYFLTVAMSTGILTNSEFQAIAGWVEAKVKMFGYTDRDVTVPTATTTDISAVNKSKYHRTFTVYDSDDFFAHVSVMARLATVNYLGLNTAITTKFKRLPTITPERLSLAKATFIRGKNANYYAYYSETPMFAEGKMLDGAWLDDVHSSDWFQNALQTAIFNSLVMAGGKVPQTDAGVSILISAARKVAEQARLSGVLATGNWRGDDIGVLKNGDYMSAGYIFQVGKVADMTAADQSARKSPVITFCGLLAGAIHFSDVTANLA